MRTRILFCGALVVLSACAKGQGISLMPYADKSASPAKFRLCHGFSCSHRTEVSLSEKQWKKVLAVFKKKSKTAQSEREKITKAMALIDKEVNKSSGLVPDLAEAHTFEGDQAQMDCIDETINASLYLKFLEDAGVFKWHEVVPPLHRGYFVNGMWPHNTAAIREKASGEIYAIDSYYFDSGMPPAVVPIDVWLDNWRPEGLGEPEARKPEIIRPPGRKPKRG